MHACGHDMILAAALILAKIVAEEQRMQESFPVRLRFLFEPAEEIGEGAKRMLQAGALENPKADAFLMFHYAADMTFWNGSASGTGIFHDQQYADSCSWKIQSLV